MVVRTAGANGASGPGWTIPISKPVKVEESLKVADTWASTPLLLGKPSGSNGHPSESNRDSVAHAHPPLDIRRALESLGGDRELFDQALAAFLDDLPHALATLQSALRQSSSERLQLTAHNLKGAVSSLGAEPTRRVAQQLEQAGREGKLQAAGAMLEELRAHLARLREFVLSWKDE